MTFHKRGGDPVPLPNLDPAFRRVQSQPWGQARVLFARPQELQNCIEVRNKRACSPVLRLL